MTFPTVAARTTTADAVAAFSHSINLGSPVAGELLVIFAATASGGGEWFLNTAVSGDGWLFQQVAGAVSLRLAIFAKIASGSDALTIGTPASTRMAATCYRITGHGSALAGGSVTSHFGSTNGDPPNAAFSGAAQDALFLAALATASSLPSAAPASYGTLTTASAGTAFVSSAERTLNATSDNPGAFTNTSQEWMATSVAIPSLALPTNARQSQQPVEAVSNIVATARATQLSAEVVSIMTATARMTQIVAEMVSQNVPDGAAASPGMLFIAT